MVLTETGFLDVQLRPCCTLIHRVGLQLLSVLLYHTVSGVLCCLFFPVLSPNPPAIPWQEQQARQYAQTSQQQQHRQQAVGPAAAAAAAAPAPFWSQASNIPLRIGQNQLPQHPLDFQMDQMAMMQSGDFFQGMSNDPHRRRSASWIDQRGTAMAGNPYAPTSHLSAHRQALFANRQQHQHRPDVSDLPANSAALRNEEMSLATLAALGRQRDALAVDPFMPLPDSISPEMGLFNVPSPALSHARDSSADSGFGLTNMDASHLPPAGGLDSGNTHPSALHTNTHTMSPIPSIGSSRPPSVASHGSFFSQNTSTVDMSSMLGDMSMFGDLGGPAGLAGSLDQIMPMDLNMPDLPDSDSHDLSMQREFLDQLDPSIHQANSILV